MSIQTPFMTAFVSIHDFGATPNDSSATARLANSEAFKQAQATMQSPGQAWGHPLFIPSGTYYLSSDLHIVKQLELFGTGLQGESVLMFPAGTSLIIDGGDGADPTSDGSDCIIRDIQIQSEEKWVTDMRTLFDAGNFAPPTLESTAKGTSGIVIGTTATIQRVYIKGFTGTGIRVRRTAKTNPNQWRIHDVYIESCGGHGIHIGGHGVDHPDKSETQGGLCSGAKIFTVAGNGIYDGSFGGNTYVGCYVEETKGRGYASEAQGQVSFIGCSAEAREPNRFAVGGTVWVGGSPGKGFTDDTMAFIAESYGGVHPFEVPNPKDPTIRLLVGYPNDGTDPTTVCAWANSNNEFHVMRWDMDNKIWAIENGAVLPEKNAAGEFVKLRELVARNIATYMTGTGHPRGPWLQGFGEMLLGSADSPIKISRGFLPDDGKRGDIVYNEEPTVGDYVGHVCIGLSEEGKAEWKPFGKIEA